KISSISASPQRAPRPYSGGVSAPVSPASPGAASNASAPPVDAEVTTQLEEVRRRIHEVEEDQRRHLAEAQNQLVDARTTLGPMHPTVVGLTEKIAQLSQPPAELVALRARERDLVGKIAKAT